MAGHRVGRGAGDPKVTLRRVVWFAGLYLAGLLCIGIVAALLRLMIP